MIPQTDKTAAVITVAMTIVVIVIVVAWTML